MADFSAFTEPTPTNSFIIQRALRQVDTAVLATAMIGLEDVYQEMIKRNISQRVTRIIEEEIELKQGAIREEQIEEARALFLELLVQAQDRTDPHEVREHAKPPQIKLGSHEDIVDTFHALAR